MGGIDYVHLSKGFGRSIYIYVNMYNIYICPSIYIDLWNAKATCFPNRSKINPVRENPKLMSLEIPGVSSFWIIFPSQSSFAEHAAMHVGHKHVPGPWFRKQTSSMVSYSISLVVAYPLVIQPT